MLSDIRVQIGQFSLGIGNADAAEVDAGYLGARFPGQPDGGRPLAASQVQRIRFLVDIAFFDHDLVELFASGQEVSPGAFVEEAPVDAAPLVPDGAVDCIFCVVVGLCFQFREPAGHV